MGKKLALYGTSWVTLLLCAWEVASILTWGHLAVWAQCLWVAIAAIWVVNYMGAVRGREQWRALWQRERDRQLQMIKRSLS